MNHSQVILCLFARVLNKRNVVYKAITDNSFVTSLTPEKANNLSENGKEEIVNHESDFLKDKIQEKDPSAKVTFIPKSLYQLFVWNLYLKEVAENPGSCLGIGRLENIPWNNKYNYGKKSLYVKNGSSIEVMIHFA